MLILFYGIYLVLRTSCIYSYLWKFTECRAVVQTHSIEWNVNCVPRVLTPLSTPDTSTKRGKRMCNHSKFKDFERHATKKSIPLLPLPAEGWRRYGWRLFSVEIDEGLRGGPATPVVINYHDVLWVTWKSGCALNFPHPRENFTSFHLTYSFVLINNLKNIIIPVKNACTTVRRDYKHRVRSERIVIFMFYIHHV